MHTRTEVLCAMGGWKDPQTLLKCYQQPSEDDQRQALEQPGRSTAGDSTH